MLPLYTYSILRLGEKVMGKRLAVWCLILLSATYTYAQQNKHNLPTDAGSLRKYVLAMNDTFQAGNMDLFDRLTSDLKLPEPDQWLYRSFGSSGDPSMTSTYESRFQAFRSRIVENFQWSSNSTVKLSVEKRAKPAEGVAASPTAPTPKFDVKTQSFKFVLAADGKGRREWEDSFLIDGGSLRFIGQGAFPFWAGPISIKAKQHP
jgi:hypothetical protein